MRLEQLQINYTFTMASNAKCSLSLLSCLILLTSLFQTSAISELSSHHDKVPVDIYYESIGNVFYFPLVLSEFITEKLLPIIDLHLVPWGFSKILSNGTFDCEAGEVECYFNTIEACAIDVWPEVEKHFKFILCIEEFMADNSNSNWKSCYDNLGLDPKPIDECYNSGHGRELELKYANETEALNPFPDLLPWVLVAGNPLEGLAEQVMSYICNAYKGPLPEICEELPPITTSSDSNEIPS